jgi:hypothetical protein
MPDSIREKILANLKAALEGITAANGYNYTVNRVDRIRSNPINHPVYPSINIWEQGMESEIDPKGFNTKKLDLVLELWTIAGGEDLSQVINKHLADVEKAVVTDTTRGGNAIDTWYTGDEVLLTNGDQLMIGAYCFITVKYRTNFFDPESID